jgi:hypothetical protein
MYATVTVSLYLNSINLLKIALKSRQIHSKPQHFDSMNTPQASEDHRHRHNRPPRIAGGLLSGEALG